MKYVSKGAFYGIFSNFHDMDKRFCYAIDKDLFVIRVQVKRMI